MSDFHLIKHAVAAQFAEMAKHSLFRVDVDGDTLWEAYQRAFPEGTNPIFRARREHDCSCCRQFIRTVGSVVAIVNGKIQTIWDKAASGDDDTYAIVATAMRRAVHNKPIIEPFLHYEGHAGADKTFEQRIGMSPMTWTHFHVNIPAKFVRAKGAIATELGKQRTAFATLNRALTEITDDAIQTVLDLIDQGSLYRGNEHVATVRAFKQFKQRYAALSSPAQCATFLWSMLNEAGASIAGIRNSVIGTLLVDLSEGVDLERAVKAFETKVAPANYKRPTALVTQAMIDKAKTTIADLGLTSALDRRYAVIGDVPVNDVLFVDRSIRKQLAGDAFDDIAPTKPTKPQNLDKVESIGIEDFIRNVLPKVNSIEVMFENKHRGNLMTLTAPTDPTAGQLFKWDNGFAWAYSGNVADSIKERVKQAGGNVTGDLCCRLAWDYDDDLDLHLVEPNQNEIYYNRKSSFNGGQLDVDANAGGHRSTTNPVENIFYTDRRRMQEGRYRLYVHNYSRQGRDSRGNTLPQGFEAEIDYLGQVYAFSYDKALRTNEIIHIAAFDYTHAGGLVLVPNSGLQFGQRSKEVWGLKTQQFVPVKMMMLSPNHWDYQAVGNKHYFFILEGAKAEDAPRGFFNEFLDNRLNDHRKVFEIVGSKLEVSGNADEQLSGLGFSDTQRTELLVKVAGSFTRTLRVQF